MKKALVLSLVAVLGLGFAAVAVEQGTLSGYWDTKVTIVPTPISLGIDSTLYVKYAVAGWNFTSTSNITQLGWKSQQFGAHAVLGAFSVDSTLDFTTMPTPAFKEWNIDGKLSLAGVLLDANFDLKPNVTKLILTGTGSAGDIKNVSVAVTLGSGLGCDFNFNEAKISFDLPFFCNCATITTTIDFTCAGFQYADFKVVGIAIPTLPWVTITADLKFEVQTKTLTLSPKFNFGTFACVGLYVAQDYSGNLTLGDIHIDGVYLSCTVGGITFTEQSYWGTGTKPDLLKGTSFWEAFQIKTSSDSCCGTDKFMFDITVYFDHGTQLFDVAEFVAHVTVPVTTQFKFTTGITLDLTQPAVFTEWTLGFYVKW